MFKLIVAISEDGIIGNKSGIPWNIPEDLKIFKEFTMNNIIVMGRRTWESLPQKPLKNRISIVFSKNEIGEDVYSVKSLDEFLVLINKIKLNKEVFIIGGSKIYELFLYNNLIDSLIVTVVKGNYDGDTYFPINYLKEYSKVNVLLDTDKFVLKEYKR